MIICITGSVAAGKTTLARMLKKELRYKYIDINKLVKEKKLYDYYDGKDKSYVVDVNKLSRFLVEIIKSDNRDLIIDSHLSHYLPKKYVDLCIVAKCDLKELKKRLEKRKYSKEKVRENLDAEIFDICLNEAEEGDHYTFVTDTTKGIKKKAISQLLGKINAIKSTGRRVK